MEYKKVSVVVPIYNVEKYLNKCIDTIVDQTYKNLEIILVDDGSKDNSGLLCDQWAEKDSRIKVIHKENGGLSSARNVGMENATGDYIMFEDSDDWLEPELIERSIECIQKDESDIVIFGYRKVDEMENDIGEFTFGKKVLTREQLTKQLHTRILEMSFGYAWNKLYNFQTIKDSGLRFDSTIIDREDLAFNMQLLSCVNKVNYLDFIGYNYLQRNTSLLHNSDLGRLNNIETFCQKMSDIDLEDEGMKRKVYNMNVLHYLSDCMIKNILWNDELSKRQKKEWIKKIIQKCPEVDKLYYDKDNPRHLNILYKTIKNSNPQYFYLYVQISDLKRKIKHK